MSSSPQETKSTASNHDIPSKIREIIRSNGILDEVSEVIVKDPDLQGEGFASQPKYITVVFENLNVQPLNLFLKGHTSNESHSQMLDDTHAFEKEVTFLTDYVSAAEKLCKSMGVPGPSELYPKCYYGDSRMIVLENLVLLDKGYIMLDKTERQDLEATKFAVQTLAKHHAISYAMIEEEKGAENFFKRFPNLDYEVYDAPNFSDIEGPTLTNALNSNIRILEKSNVDGKDEALSFYNGFKDTSVIGLAVDTLKYDENELLVLNHGDYWNNNMLFLKDTETNQIVGHKAIDLQVTRYNSPALDLSYYLFMSVKTDVRLAHLKDILEHYLEILNKVSSDLGHPISLSYEQLLLTFRKKFHFGYWNSMFMVLGRGIAILKEIDMNTTDLKDFSAVFDKLVQKWLDENPEYQSVIAEELVKLSREYKQISLH